MIDPFALSEAPLGEPLSIVTGLSAQWRKCMNIDPALFEFYYSLRRFTPVDGADVVNQTIPMVHVEDDLWGVDIVQGTITSWETGRFFWDLIVKRIADDRIKVIETGEIRVFSSLGDRRSHAQVMLSKIESVIEGRADSDVESYTIKSRSITKMGVSELTKWRDYYLLEVNNQSSVEGLFAEPQPNKSTVKIRFTH